MSSAASLPRRPTEDLEYRLKCPDCCWIEAYRLGLTFTLTLQVSSREADIQDGHYPTAGSGPAVWQRFVKLLDGLCSDAGEHLLKPCKRVHARQF